MKDDRTLVRDRVKSPIASLGREGANARQALRSHWPVYVMETGELRLDMFFACLFATFVQHPASPIRRLITSGILRRALMGLAVRATVIAMVLTLPGKQSGGHFHPAITFTDLRLGNVAFWGALYYGAAQIVAATCGVAVAIFALRGALKNMAVCYAVTAPGVYGEVAAFVAELSISFFLMITVLVATNREALARYSVYFVGVLYAVFVTFEAPLPGTSMNPARTFASAFHAAYWDALWIYFIAPTLGMLIATEVFLGARRSVPPFCANLKYHDEKRCIFHHNGERISRAGTFKFMEVWK